MRVLLTRSPEQNFLMRRQIEAQLSQHSLRIFEAPLLEQVAISDANESLHNYLLEESINDVIFISPSAVKFGFDKVHELIDLSRVFAVGRGTANLLSAKLQKNVKDIEVVFPEKGVGSEALLELPNMQSITNSKILIVTGSEGKPLLENALIERSAKVIRWECYRRQKTSKLSQQLEDALQSGLDCVFLHSAHAARHFVAELPIEEKLIQQAKSIVAIVGAKTIADELRDQGWLGKIKIADSPIPADMLSKLLNIA